jgi:hypothetical protein
LQQRALAPEADRRVTGDVDFLQPVALPQELLAALERKLDRNNRWDLSRNEGVVTIVVGGEAIEATLETVPLGLPKA